jgi:hypothetical protein
LNSYPSAEAPRRRISFDSNTAIFFFLLGDER